MKNEGSSGMLLEGLRVLDVTDEKGFLCGRTMADLGADVIKIERPGGDPSRRIGPFFHDTADSEKSLNWFVYNANKKGITLNIETADGKEIFKKLSASADIVVESFSPGYLDSIGLGYSTLSALNPGIILTSITPFGQTGPLSKNKASDLTLMAASGYMYVLGDADRAPLRLSFPQSYLHAGAEAAAATLIAYHIRKATGVGQQVDISIQECVMMCLMAGLQYWEFNKKMPRRAGPYQQVSSLAIRRMIWKCSDGYVCFGLWGGDVGARNQGPLVKWMDSEGMAPDFLKAMDWANFDMNSSTTELLEHLADPISKFFLKHTREELFRGARERYMMLYPVSEPSDLMTSEQLRSRGFWVEVEHPELGTTITYPGVPIKLSEFDLKIRRPAPLIGEHNEEIYNELGLAKNDLLLLKQVGVI